MFIIPTIGRIPISRRLYYCVSSAGWRIIYVLKLNPFQYHARNISEYLELSHSMWSNTVGPTNNKRSILNIHAFSIDLWHYNCVHCCPSVIQISEPFAYRMIYCIIRSAGWHFIWLDWLCIFSHSVCFDLEWLVCNTNIELVSAFAGGTFAC